VNWLIMMNKKDLLPRYEIGKLLQLTQWHKITSVLKEYSLSPALKDSNMIEYYTLEDVKFLLKKQNELYDTYNNLYINYGEAINLGATHHDIAQVQNMHVPVIIRIQRFFNTKIVYPKTEILDRIKKKESHNLQSYTTKEVAILFELTYGQANTLLRNLNLNPIIINRSNYLWIKEEIDRLVVERKELYEYYSSNYITHKEACEKFNINRIPKSDIDNYNIVIEPLPSLIKYGRFLKTHVIISKKSFEDYISVITNQQHLIEKIRIKNEKKVKKVKKEIKLSEKDKLREKLKMNYFTFKETKELLNLSKEILNRLMQEEGIPPTLLGNNKYYEKEIIMSLVKKQKMLYEKFIKEYIYLKDVWALKISTHVAMNFSQINIPTIIRKEKFKNMKIVYPLIEVDEYLAKKNRLELQKKFLNESPEPFSAFSKLIKEFKVEFTENSQITKKYWISYVQQTLNKTKGNKQSVNKRIVRFVNITQLLVDITKTKELFSNSSNELNLLIFNENIYQGYRIDLFTFLNSINNLLPYSIIDISKINNPNEEKRAKETSNAKDVYTPTEFIDLLNYVIKVDFHKLRAIKDIYNLINKRNIYKKYDSTWLYILLHMNNGWRSSDFTSKIPRIEIPSYIKELKDFEELKLNLEDAKNIVNQLISKLQSTIHSKNQKSAHFFCSDEILYPLANAIILCELRTRLINPTSSFLIDFMNERNDMNKGANDYFFNNFDDGFKFGSLKMNRTFIGLMTDVIKKKTNRNPLEITKFIRNHSDMDTTNTYINIPQEHLDFITRQLFDTGYFGYTYDLFSTLLNNNKLEHIQKNEQNTLIKNIFGDIYKIENLASYLNLIEKGQHDVSAYLNELSIEELQEKLNLLNLGQLPAKEAYYQCIFGSCIFLERECNKCPFAVPHLYVLTTLGERMVKRVYEYQEIINNCDFPGEKTWIANLLIKDLLLLKEAKQKFGEDILSVFLNIDYEELKALLNNLTDPYNFMTIGRSQV
jgi:hypothetical protein